MTHGHDRTPPGRRKERKRKNRKKEMRKGPPRKREEDGEDGLPSATLQCSATRLALWHQLLRLEAAEG
jgi:hypothetical protein